MRPSLSSTELNEVIKAIDDITADAEQAFDGYDGLAEWWNGMYAAERCQLVEERLGRDLSLPETYFVGGHQL